VINIENNELCKFLVNAGTDISKADTMGRNVIHYAAMKESPKLIEFLYSYWKNPPVITLPEDNFNITKEVPKVDFEEKKIISKRIVDILADMNEIDVAYENVIVIYRYK